MPPVVLKHGLLALWLSDKSVRTRVTRAHDLLTSVVTPDLCVDKLAVSSVGVCLHSGVSTPRWTRHGLSADTMNTTTTVSGAHGKGDTLESSSLDKILANTQCETYESMPPCQYYYKRPKTVLRLKFACQYLYYLSTILETQEYFLANTPGVKVSDFTSQQVFQQYNVLLAS